LKSGNVYGKKENKEIKYRDMREISDISALDTQ